MLSLASVLDEEGVAVSVWALCALVVVEERGKNLHPSQYILQEILECLSCLET